MRSGIRRQHDEVTGFTGLELVNQCWRAFQLAVSVTPLNSPVAILFCHSVGPVMWALVPASVDRHRHRHVLHVEFVDRFHAQVGKADDLWPT